jgi:acetyl-CoA acetyltransferase
MPTGHLGGRAAIVGIGATEFSKDSGRSELRLAVEAVVAAVADAGLQPGDIDGLVTYTMDTNPETEVARNVGIPEVTFIARSHYGGGGACATVQLAAMAVVTGAARAVVVYRAFNERSGRRFGAGILPTSAFPYKTSEDVAAGWTKTFGLVTPAGRAAMHARRYMHETGTTTEAFGRVAVIDRLYAASNPAAFYYNRPITLEDHQSSRWIVEPLRLLDCCQESDGGAALVVTTLERARDLPRRPVVIKAVAQGSAAEQESMTSYTRSESGLPEMAVVARQLWGTTGLRPQDMQAAILYDHFTPFVLMQLEALGYCKKGEAGDFLAAGHAGPGGRLPINTHGGQLGEAYLHGINGILEAVRQVRGAAVNQVPMLEHAIVTGGTGVPTSGMLLGTER